MKVTLFGSFKATYWSYWSGTGYNFKDTDFKICLVGNIKVTKLTLLNYWQSRLSRLRMYQKITILLLVCYLIIWRHSYWVWLVNTWLGISTPSNTYSCFVREWNFEFGLHIGCYTMFFFCLLFSNKYSSNFREDWTLIVFHNTKYALSYL